MKTLLILGLLGISGCKTVEDPDDPFSNAYRAKQKPECDKCLERQRQGQTCDQIELETFKDQLRSFRIEKEPFGPAQSGPPWTTEEILACIQSRANAALPPTLPIRLIAVLPNHPVREESYLETKNETGTPELTGLDTDISIYDMLRALKDVCGLDLEFAPRSRTVIFYRHCQPSVPPNPHSPSAQGSGGR